MFSELFMASLVYCEFQSSRPRLYSEILTFKRFYYSKDLNWLACLRAQIKPPAHRHTDTLRTPYPNMHHLLFKIRVSLCSPIGQELTCVATQIDLEFMAIPLAQPSQLKDPEVRHPFGFCRKLSWKTSGCSTLGQNGEAL